MRPVRRKWPRKRWHSRSGRALLKKKPRAKLQRGKQAETSAQREKPNARPQRGKQAETSAQREKPIARPQRGKQARPSAQQKKPNAGLHRGKQARTSTQGLKPNAGLHRAKRTRTSTQGLKPRAGPKKRLQRLRRLKKRPRSSANRGRSNASFMHNSPARPTRRTARLGAPRRIASSRTRTSPSHHNHRRQPDVLLHQQRGRRPLGLPLGGVHCGQSDSKFCCQRHGRRARCGTWASCRDHARRRLRSRRMRRRGRARGAPRRRRRRRRGGRRSSSGR